MYSLRNNMYNGMIYFFKKIGFMWRKQALKNVNIRTVSASSGLWFRRHWMNTSATTMGFAVKAHL